MTEPRSVEHLATRLCYVAIVAMAVYVRFPALDPASLWSDDVWVAALAKHAGLADLLTYSATVPVGLCAILMVFVRLVPDPELSAQLFPFLCSIVAVAVCGRLASVMTGRRSVGLLAAALMAVNPMMVAYATRVKPFSVDALVIVGLLLAGLPHLEEGSVARLARLSVLSLGALLLSYVSIFLSAPLLHVSLLVCLLADARPSPARARRAVLVVAAFDVCAAAYYLARMRGQSPVAVEEYWSDAFLRVDSFGALGQSMHRLYDALVLGAFPRDTQAWLVPLALLGAITLLTTHGGRLRASVIAGFTFVVAAASALSIYPVGTGRTDIFAYPVAVVLACLGVGALSSFASAITGGRASRVVSVAVGSLALMVAVQHRWPQRYPEVADASFVRLLESKATPQDAVLIGWDASFPFAYYTTWPMKGFFPRGDRGFLIRPLRSNACLVNLESPRDVPMCLKGRDRAYYLELHVSDTRRISHEPLYAKVRAAGFRPVTVYQSAFGRMIEYARTSG